MGNPSLKLSEVLFHFDLAKFISKNCKYIFFYQKFVHLGENTSTHCSRIILVHVHATVFFLFTQLSRINGTYLEPNPGRHTTLKLD